jgi:hypothetical protein
MGGVAEGKEMGKVHGRCALLQTYGAVYFNSSIRIAETDNMSDKAST